MLYKFQYKLHPCGDTSGWTWQWQQVWSLKINYIHVETPQAEHDSDNKYDHLNYIHVETPQAEHDNDNKYDHLNYIHVETPQAEHDSDNKYDHLK